MSLSVERLKESRGEAYDYGNSLIYVSQKQPLTEYEGGLLKTYIDTVKAYDELIAIKEADPVAVIDDNHELTIGGSWIGHVPWLQSNMRLIRKPE